ncbi:MAG: phosphatidylglycerol lysyltransferase domain-containing protein [Acetobacteraceae bacterium]|nr:phosphatidylglycerol lysyltransferase domain-containing protein [Acetobacteraceae bacterium]
MRPDAREVLRGEVVRAGWTAGARRHLPALLGLALLIGALYVVQRELASLRLDDVLAAMAAIPNRSLALAVVLTVAAYLVLTLYDALGTRFVGHPLSYGRIAFASFTAYALSHNIGFAMVSGAAIRYRLYALWGMSGLQIAGVVAFCSLTFVLGGLTLGGLVLLAVPHAIPGFGPWMPAPVMYAVGVAMLGLVGLYVVAGRLRGRPFRFGRTEVPLPGPRLALMQVALASFDVALTAAIFYALLPAAPGLDFLVFLAIYVTAYTAAMASHVPGGLGVFDGTVLLGLSGIVPTASAVGALVVFRLLYYVLPLFLAGGLFAVNEIVLRRVAMARAFDLVARWGAPFVAPVLSATVTLAGLVMLFLGTMPPFEAPFAWAGATVRAPIAEVSHFVASLLGAILLVLAYGLWRRVTMAWASVLVTLVLAAGLAAAKGHGWPVPALMLAIAASVVPFRRAFYRDTRLIAEPFTAGWVAAVVALAVCTVSLALFTHLRRDWMAETWWQFVLAGEAPWSLRATLLLGILLLLLALVRLLRPARIVWVAVSPAAQARWQELTSAALPERAEALVFGEDGRAAIPFLRLPGIWLAIGDPAGEATDRVSAIWRFRDLCDQEGVDPAFWRVGPELLPVYADLGLTAFPITEEGEVAPESEGDAPEARAYLVCKAERDLVRLLPVVGALERRSEAAPAPA